MHTIKESIGHDYRYLITDESRQKQLFIWRKYIETIFEQMGKHMITIYDGLVTFGIACEQESKKQSSSITLQPCDNKRKTISDNNPSHKNDFPRYTEMTESDKKIYRARQRNKNKHERDLKLERHTAEEMWNATRENNTKLQLMFERLQYVNCSYSTNFLDESKEYLKSCSELKDNDYRDHHGDLHTKEHFLMYTKGKKSAHVIDECWFKIYDENMIFFI